MNSPGADPSHRVRCAYPSIGLQGFTTGEGHRCTVIHNLKRVCSQGHTFTAISYDDAQHTKAEAAYQLGRGESLIAKGGPPVCAVCGSVVFHLEDVVTEYRSMLEAIPPLIEIALGEMRERDELVRSADRN